MHVQDDRDFLDTNLFINTPKQQQQSSQNKKFSTSSIFNDLQCSENDKPIVTMPDQLSNNNNLLVNNETAASEINQGSIDCQNNNKLVLLCVIFFN